jgi:hypothetical protein
MYVLHVLQKCQEGFVKPLGTMLFAALDDAEVRVSGLANHMFKKNLMIFCLNKWEFMRKYLMIFCLKQLEVRQAGAAALAALLVRVGHLKVKRLSYKSYQHFV